MSVYRRGYQRYQGKIEGRRTRFLVLPRFSWKKMFEQRLVVFLLASAMVWPLLCAAFIYFSNNADVIGEMPAFQNFLEVNENFFMIFMNTQKLFAVFLAALTGPGLIAPDIANNALQLYFSRPLTRVDYTLGRLAAIMGLLSLITWIPGLVLFFMQAALAGNGWGIANWRLGFGIFTGFMLWIFLVALTALASSALAKLRVIAGGLILGFFFILSGVAGMINGVFRGTWGHLLNPSRTVERIVYALAGMESADGPGAASSIAAFLVILLILAFILERKLRPAEVVS